MKKKTKIAVASTVIIITSLMIASYHTQPKTSPVPPPVAPVSEVIEVNKACTMPTPTEPIVAEEITKISTQAEETIEPSQPTEKSKPTDNPLPFTQISTKQTFSSSSSTREPKMGDTRMVGGQKQVYFLGFDWIDDTDEPNVAIYAEDMYENGNKVGIMD